MKPAFVVVCAWLFSERERGGEMPGNFLAMLLFGTVAAARPSALTLTRAMLTTGTWGAMFFLAGLPMFWILVLGGLAVCGGISAYFMFDHVAGRINRFMTGEGDTLESMPDAKRFCVAAGSDKVGRRHHQAHHPGQPYPISFSRLQQKNTASSCA